MSYHHHCKTIVSLISLLGLSVEAAPVVSALSPVENASIGSLSSVSVTFNEAVSGVDAGDLLINGVVASSVSGAGAGPYVFNFTQPAAGTVSLEWEETHGITGLGTGSYVPTGAWGYTLLDNAAPLLGRILSSAVGQEILHVFPTPGASVSELTQCTLVFSEPVTGVDVADLLINGNAASSVTGSEAGPYVFVFNQPANGLVNFTWQSTTGIVDANGNAFVAENWSVTKVASLGSVVITEFLAANAGGVANTVNGTRDENFDLSPWIELYNPGTTSVDLRGWSLTNEVDDSDLWIFPTRNLAAGARLIIWASGKDRKPISGHLHANFTLSVNGGYLALHTPNHPRGNPVSRFPADYPLTEEYPPQRYDYSYGLQDGDHQLRYFSPPTVTQSAYTLPSAANPNPTAPVVPVGEVSGTSLLSAITPDPSASVKRGFFAEPFSVILTCPQADAAIHYTTNGSLPLASDPVYVSPIPISTTTVLRFAAFGENQVPSETITHTYFFSSSVFAQKSPPYTPGNLAPVVGGESLPSQWGTQSGFGFPGLITNLPANAIPADYGMDEKIHADPNRYADDGSLDSNGLTNAERMERGLRSLPVLSIVMKNNDMFGTGGLYPTSTSANKADNTKACSLEMFSADGTTIFSSNAGIDNHGNASRDPYKNPKHGYTIRFKGRYGNGRLKAKLFPDSPVEEWDKFVLRGDFGFSWLHWDGTLQRPRGIRIRDVFCKEAFRDMGRIAGYSRFVNVMINGVYWGTFDIAEDEAQDFVASYFGGDKNGYDVIEQNALKNGQWTAYREIKRILGWTSAPNYNTAPNATMIPSAFTDQKYEEIKQYVDVPWYADYMILHYLVGHEDWGTQTAYDKNWYALRPPGDTFKYLPWDMENLMNSPTINRVSGAQFPPTAIQKRLDKNAQYRLDFADRVNLHMVNPDGALLAEANIARLNQWGSIMNADAICLESARWGDYRDRVHVYSNDSNIVYTWNGSWFENGSRSTTPTHWLAEMNRLRNDYFTVRTTNVLGQLRTAGLYSLLNAPEFRNNATNAQIGSIQVDVGFLLKMQLPSSPPAGTTNSGTIYYTTDGSDPRVYFDTSGTISTSAQAYSAAIPINATTTVKARTLNGTTWSALRESTYTVGHQLPRVVISEIHYRPSSGATSREFVEIHNAGNRSVDVSNWTFEGIDFIVPFGTIMNPGTRLVIANNDNPTAFAAAYPAVIVLGYFSGSLDNSDERISLLDRQGRVVSSVHYFDKAPWPTSPDGGGPSLELIDSLSDIDDAGNWKPSNSNHGTPGQSNSSTLASTLILAEFSTTGFIEIQNTSEAVQSTAGWKILIRQSDLTDLVVPLPSTSVLPGALFSIPINLPRQHGSLQLVDASNRTRDGLRYGPQASGFSFSRIGGVWTLSTPTPGTVQSAATQAAVSSLVLNEIHANPLPGQDDWLEIANSASLPISLIGLQLGIDGKKQIINVPTAIGASSQIRIFAKAVSRSGDSIAWNLPAAGATLDFSTATGTIIDSLSYASQSEGSSLGRLPHATGTWSALPYPSPAAANHAILSDVPQLHEVLVRNHSGEINPWAHRSSWIELKNSTASAITLDAWSLRAMSDAGDQSTKWTIPSGTILASGAFIRIWADPLAPAIVSSSEQLNCALAIDSESRHDYLAWGLELLNPLGQVVDQISWGMQIDDRSIGRTPAGEWRLLAVPTPGAANASASLLDSSSAVKINEWTGATIAFGGNDWKEYIELYHPGAQPADLAGLWLGDNPSESGRRKWRFPSLSFIPAQGHAVLLSRTGTTDPARVNFAIDGAGEMLLLSDSSSTLHSVNFGSSNSSVSSGLAPDGSSSISSMIPTPGSSNFTSMPSQPQFYLQPRTESLSAGSLVVLRVGATPVTSYQWYHNGSALPGATQSSLALGPLTRAHDGSYHCVALDSSGSTSSNPASLTVLYNYPLLAQEKSLGLAAEDDDADGVPNGVELILGTDPRVEESGAIHTTLGSDQSGAFFTTTFRQSSRAYWSEWTGELASDLENWSETASSSAEVLEVHANGDKTLRWKFPIPPNESKHFLRLRMEP